MQLFNRYINVNISFVGYFKKNFVGLSAKYEQKGSDFKVSKSKKTSAIILAGGSGSRFGHAGGKQLVDLAGKPMLTWSVMAFDKAKEVGEIIVVCPPDKREEYIEAAIEPFNIDTPIKYADAGTIRQESSFNGLEAVGEEFELVAIHDGARPHITSEIIDHAISELKGNYDMDGAVVGFPCIDTIKVVDSDGVIAGTPDRSCLWMAYTPQIFRRDILVEAQRSSLADGFVGTDDSSLVERLGGKILAINGKRDNIKLTEPEDYAILSSTVVSTIKEIASTLQNEDE